MEKFERKFEVSPEGEAEKKELTEEEEKELEKKRKKRKLLALKKDRHFVADEKGNIEVKGSGKEKLAREDLETGEWEFVEEDEEE